MPIWYFIKFKRQLCICDLSQPFYFILRVLYLKLPYQNDEGENESTIKL